MPFERPVTILSFCHKEILGLRHFSLCREVSKGRCLFWGDSLHCLGFFISYSHGVVNVVNLEYCRRGYNCSPPLIFVLADWLRWVMDSQKLFFFVLFCLEVHILYIIARAVTLILAFTSLRDLPPRAYETVNWTTLIPHV